MFIVWLVNSTIWLVYITKQLHSSPLCYMQFISIKRTECHELFAKNSDSEQVGTRGLIIFSFLLLFLSPLTEIFCKTSRKFCIFELYSIFDQEHLASKSEFSSLNTLCGLKLVCVKLIWTKDFKQWEIADRHMPAYNENCTDGYWWMFEKGF